MEIRYHGGYHPTIFAVVARLRRTQVNTLFCRHNRFTVDCPICSKGSLLGSSKRKPAPRAQTARSSSASTATRRRSVATVSAGPFASVGPYVREPEGERYDVRLERVPGGIRLAEWSRGQLTRRAPELATRDLAALVAAAGERQVLAGPDLAALSAALDPDSAPAPRVPLGAPPSVPGSDGPVSFGASSGRAGDMWDELRVEPLDRGMVRVARWVFRPGGSGWQITDAPPLLPAARYGQALAAATLLGLLPAPG